MLTEDILVLQNHEIKLALRELVNSLNPTHSIDFVYNTKRSLEGARDDLKLFHAIVERALLGKYFYRKPAKDRIKSICFPERINSNLHYHGIFSIPKRYQSKFTTLAVMRWFKICRQGHLEILPLITDDQRIGKINYCHKEIFKVQNYENFVLHSEFWSFKNEAHDLTTVPLTVYPR